MARSLEARLARLEARVSPRRTLTALEAQQALAAVGQEVEAWLSRLGETMDARHLFLLQAWAEDDLSPCGHDPCPLPSGLRQLLDTL